VTATKSGRTQRGLSAATKLEDWIDYAIRSDCAPFSLAQFDNLAQKTRLSRLVVQRVQVNVASLRLFLRSSTGPNRAFEPQSLGRVRDPVGIAEGPTHDFGFSILDCGLKQHGSHCRKRLCGERGSSSIAFMRGSGQGHPLSGTWATWMAPDVMPTK
jgi:hypothetical protein